MYTFRWCFYHLIYIDLYPFLSGLCSKLTLVGREQEIKDLENIINRPGQHAIVIGDRGVGKTSLVKLVLSKKRYNDIWRTCDVISSFSHVFKSLLKNCGIDFRQFEESNEIRSLGKIEGSALVIKGAGQLSRKYAEKYRTTPVESLTPWDIYESLKQIQKKCILVLDEYDAIHRGKNPEVFHENLAYTMKILADHSDKCDSKLVVVGVARTSTDLLGKHESIQRSTREIYLQPLRCEHIIDFINLAEKDLNIKFDDDVKQQIAYGSLGYPYYVHLVGLECIEAMLNRDKNKRNILWEDFEIAVKKAVNKAFRAELGKYNAVLRVSDPVEKAIIETLAIIPEMYPKRDKLYLYLKSVYPDVSREEFEAALNRQTQEKRFLFLSKRNDEIRFLDPLMKPFLSDRVLEGKESIKINDVRFLWEEEKSIQIDWNGYQVWLPKSQVKYRKTRGKIIIIPKWLFKKKFNFQKAW